MTVDSTYISRLAPWREMLNWSKALRTCREGDGTRESLSWSIFVHATADLKRCSRSAVAIIISKFGLWQYSYSNIVDIDSKGDHDKTK